MFFLFASGILVIIMIIITPVFRKVERFSKFSYWIFLLHTWYLPTPVAHDTVLTYFSTVDYTKVHFRQICFNGSTVIIS